MIIILLASVLLGLILWELLFRIRYRKLDNIPGRKPLPIIGNIHQISATDVLNQVEKIRLEYGNLTKSRIAFRPPIIFMSNPKQIEVLLASQKFLKKGREDYKTFRPWLGDGLLTSTGSKWKKHRRIITPTFHFKIIEDFVDIFNSCGDILIKKLGNEASIGEVFDVYPYVTLCTLDVICETAMGTPINAQINSKSQYVQAVQKICDLIPKRDISMWKFFDFLYQFSAESKEHQKCLDILHGTTIDVIKTRREQLINKVKNVQQTDEFGKKRRMAFLDMLLEATVDGEPLSDLSIREEVDTFMFEGHDTTASAISFLLYLLANNPEAQEKAYAEVKDILGNDKTKLPTYQELSDMKYLEMAIKEGLRMYPSVPFFIRELEEDMDLGDGYVLSKGSYPTVFVYGLHRNADIYPEPDQYRPERFLDLNRSPYAFIPFSAGPRNCIGQKFAMIEMKTLVAKILMNYKLSSAGPGNEPILQSKLVLKSDNGMKIKISHRH